MNKRPFTLRNWVILTVLVVVLLVLGATAVRAAATTTVTYSYDAAGRLTSADYSGGTAITYSYDDNGNLTQRLTNAVPTAISLVGMRAEQVGWVWVLPLLLVATLIIGRATRQRGTG